MKATLILILGLVLPLITNAADIEESTRIYKEVYVTQEGTRPVKIKFKLEYTTQDTCNGFGLGGGLKPVGTSESRAQQFYVADLLVSSTRMACPPGKARVINLESDVITLKAIGKKVDVRLLLPAEAEVVLVK